MIIYRYSLNKELEFELQALEVQETSFSGTSYRVKVRTTNKYIDRELVETESLNKSLLSHIQYSTVKCFFVPISQL